MTAGARLGAPEVTACQARAIRARTVVARYGAIAPLPSRKNADLPVDFLRRRSDARESHRRRGDRREAGRSRLKA